MRVVDTVRVGTIVGVGCLLVARGVTVRVGATLLDKEKIPERVGVFTVVTVIDPRLLILTDTLTLPVNRDVGDAD